MRFNQTEGSSLFESLLVTGALVMMGGSVYYTMDFASRHTPKNDKPADTKVIPAKKIAKNTSATAIIFKEQFKRTR